MTGRLSAGKVIQAFGSFVVGGNYLVGIIVFLILVIINFMVITKGAGRIAEVAARFTLDGMPGKQMSIDADLNAGLITEQEARERREVIAQEAEYYGAMDGANKFVRGDAIAGIIITFVNILAGLADIYSTTISTLSPRIMVRGEPLHLQNPENINRIRALLLAGIRSAMLWRQCGGRRLQILLGRKRLWRISDDLMRRAQEQQ